VFTTSKTVLAKVAVGDLISLSGKVSEFRSSTAPDDLFGTELDSPTNITVLAKNSTITPVVIGKDRFPPTQQMSALDVAAGHDGWLAVPNNQSQIDSVNATLQPTKFGLDFWESLEGQLITVPAPTALDFENSFGEFWVYGDWPVTGKNSRNTLTITIGMLPLWSCRKRITHAYQVLMDFLMLTRYAPTKYLSIMQAKNNCRR
jgi:hypothetical protein